MKKGESITIYYRAWNMESGDIRTGDVANHTCQWSKDGGTPYTLANAPQEIGNGFYKVTLSASDTNCSTGLLSVTSSTTKTIISTEIWGFTEGGSAPTAAQVSAAVWNESSRTLTASPTDVSALATSSDLADVKETVDKILGVSSYFTIEENTLQTYDESGTELQAYTLTVDTKGNITGIEPTAEE